MFDSANDGSDPNDDYDPDVGIRIWLAAKLDAIAQWGADELRCAVVQLCDVLSVLHDYRLRHSRVPRLGLVGLRLQAMRQRLETLFGPL